MRIAIIVGAVLAFAPAAVDAAPETGSPATLGAPVTHVAPAPVSRTHIILRSDRHPTDTENAYAMAICSAADVTGALLDVLSPYGQITAGTEHAFTPTIPLAPSGPGLGWLVTASRHVVNGVYFDYNAVCHSATGDQFSLLRVEAAGYPPTLVETKGTWTGHGAHGTWTALGGSDNWSITTVGG